LWGILAWFMGYIPSIGFIIALIPPLIIAWAQNGWTTALIVLVGYILINGSIQNFVQPKIMGQGLRISPVVVFVSLFVWAYLLGGIGAILAVPMTLLVLTILENFESTRTLTVLMRYTGEKEEGERRAAIEQVKGLYTKARASFSSSTPAKE
jgi:AI-2 transport protein TqsA